MPLAIFGINNSGLDLAVNLLVLFLVVVWLALIAWTYLDAKRRIQDPVLIMCATVASLFPYVGTIIYVILRPPEFIEDAHERELEIRASELRVKQLEEQSCPNCEHPIERTYLRCPNCRARVKDPCESCGKPIDPRWSLCPYCETPIQRSAPARRPGAPGDQPERRPTRTPSRAARPKAAPREKAQPSRQAQPSASKERQSGGRRAAGTRREGGSGEDRPRPATAR
jgi:hypothetical protein